MICQLFLSLRTFDVHADQPACAVVVLNGAVMDVLSKVAAMGQQVREAGGFCVSFLCDFKVYSHAHVPEKKYWQDVVDELEEKAAIPVWSSSMVDWGESRSLDVCLALSYGDDDIVFRCHELGETSCIESCFIPLSDIYKWTTQGS